MTRLVGVHSVFPPFRYAQSELTAAFAALCLPAGESTRTLQRLHTNAGVGHRHLALPLERYASLTDLTTANDAYLEAATDLGTQAIKGALQAAGIAPGEVDLVVSTTVTGIAVPSLEARVAARVGLRPDVVRVPLFGLGCVAGAAGIARLHDYLRGRPGAVAVLLSVELCSLTIQRDDRSMANLVASGLFGDGAAAVVAVGPEHPAAEAAGPRVVASRSHLYPDTERTMGWDLMTTGLRIVLDAQVPELVERYLGDDVRSFLSDNGLQTTDIAAWVSHPGGPKVIDAIVAALGVDQSALELTWRSLARVGNLSSASVLHVLADTLAENPPPPAGSPGLMLALGPGFCSELVLLEW